MTASTASSIPANPRASNIYEAMQGGKEVDQAAADPRRGPRSRLEHDEVIKSAMPDEMYKVFTHYKPTSGRSFNATVTEWDVEMYLDCLP